MRFGGLDTTVWPQFFSNFLKSAQIVFRLCLNFFALVITRVSGFFNYWVLLHLARLRTIPLVTKLQDNRIPTFRMPAHYSI